ncbi:MAG: SigB/SigF/SigG family RNA polymerase sigma factor [Oscillospiraceae bacterium]|nr:SigB/SigF/SigG family RNA polymerase sigma factor [Oscillospiraceae bacterium]
MKTVRDNAALIERVREGDKQAENIMVEENMGLVYSIVKRFTNRGYDAEDLVQIGAIGLIKAVKKFNPEFNVQFSTYAVPMITGEIKRFLRDDGAVKISRTLKENAMKGRRSEEILRKKLNRQPTIKEISQECGIEAENLLEAFEAAAPPESIYESIYDNGDKEIHLLDTIAGEEIEESVINKVMIDDILKRLKPREKEVILLRYFRGKTQTEIAAVMGVSQVQISRIEKKAIERIRGQMP